MNGVLKFAWGITGSKKGKAVLLSHRKNIKTPIGFYQQGILDFYSQYFNSWEWSSL